MRIPIALAFAAVAFAAAGYLDGRGARDDRGSVGSPVSYTSQPVRGSGSGSPIERLERSIKMKVGSKKALGDFRLSSGRNVQLSTVDTDDAKACLVEDDPVAGAGAGCLEGGLFRQRRVAFSVNTDGGPGRFDELYVVGVVAPNIASAALILTNGSEVPLRLTRERTFLYESPARDLAVGNHPVGFRLFGPSGRLVETVSFPPAES